MKKFLNVFSLTGVLLVGFAASLAAANNEDLLVSDDRIFSLGNKYTSMISSLYEEETARLGLSGYHYSITKRDQQREIAKTKALTSLIDTLNNIRPNSLSPYAKADYYTLKELAGLKYFNSKIRNQFQLDPMWYLEPLDTVYEILLKNFLPEQERLSYALKRLEMMPEILKQAEENLTNPPNLTLRLSIQKIDLETNNLTSLSTLVSRISNDKVTKKQIKQILAQVQTALSKYKKFLQAKVDSGEQEDFRVGEDNYEYLFDEVYMIPSRYGKLLNTLNKNLKQATTDLLKELDPKFAAEQAAKEAEEGIENEVLQEEEDENYDQNETLTQAKAQPKNYYTLARKYKNAPEYDKVLKSYSNEIKNADKFFVTKKLFPTLSLPIVITPAPPILRNLPYQVTVYPPIPLAEKQNGDILISLPQKVNLDKNAFALNYNYGKIKFNTAEFVTPGQTLIYSAESNNLSMLNKLSNDIFYIHGWIKYALDTAYENGFFKTDEDKLNYLWFNYKRAVYAVVDYKLQTRVMDYNEALEFIKNAGIRAGEAKVELDYLALRPFDAVSYILGAQEFERLKTKYKKKEGKKFDLLNFHTKVLSVGRIPLIALEESLQKAYSKKEVDSYFNMTYF